MQQTSRPAASVLVVEDDPDVRDLLVEHFKDRGFDVAATGDGRAAVTAVTREPSRYTLIFTDLNLPGADGLAVLEAARSANPAIRVVIITGYASLDSAIQAVRLGAFDYLTKPFSIGQIDLVLQRAAQSEALELENRQLARRSAEDSTDRLASDLLARLGDIEARLAAIERLLRARF